MLQVKIVFFLLVAVATTGAFAAEISRHNTVDWVLASAKGSSTSHFVQWGKAINTACTNKRTRFSFEDKDIMSLLLAAKVSGKKVGFYYDLQTKTNAVPGHGSGCQLLNVWLESD